MVVSKISLLSQNHHFFVKWFDKESTKFASAWSHEFKEKIQTVVFEVYSFEGNPVTWEGPLKDYSLQN